MGERFEAQPHPSLSGWWQVVDHDYAEVDALHDSQADAVADAAQLNEWEGRVR